MQKQIEIEIEIQMQDAKSKMQNVRCKIQNDEISFDKSNSSDSVIKQFLITQMSRLQE
jgi:hypothetical protein